MDARERNAAEPTLIMSRVFDAPRELVFEVWTDPQHDAGNDTKLTLDRSTPVSISKRYNEDKGWNQSLNRFAGEPANVRNGAET
ncbi:MAG: hypothetical protein ACJ8J7_06445 [Sulfurifustaceae bacterium]